MKKKMTTTGDMKIASEEDLLTLDASTSENIYRPFTPEDFRDFETDTIHVREVAQRVQKILQQKAAWSVVSLKQSW